MRFIEVVMMWAIEESNLTPRNNTSRSAKADHAARNPAEAGLERCAAIILKR